MIWPKPLLVEQNTKSYEILRQNNERAKKENLTEWKQITFNYLFWAPIPSTFYRKIHFLNLGFLEE